MIEILVIFLSGLAMLLIGGQLLVNGSVRIAKRFGMSPLLIGLTLVAFGTSAPELVTSIRASFAGVPGIAIGNVVGSNIANLLVILGFTALLCPIPVSNKILRQDSIMMLAVSVLFVAVSLFLPLNRWVGGIYVLLLGCYIVHGWLTDKPEAAPLAKQIVVVRDGIFASSILVFVGLVLLAVGGNFFVSGASGLARFLGISETVIGLTIVALGTSAPELVTSIVAAFRKEPDIALGNVVGSNIYNILGIAGITGIIAPTVIPADILIDNWVMLGVTILTIGFFWRRRRLMRHEGILLLLLYAGYIYWLLQR